MNLPRNGKIIQCVGKNKIEISDQPVGKPNDHQILVQSNCTLISTGTELWDIDRNKPAHDYPHKIGYCTIGTVVQTGSSVSRFDVGDRIFCTLGHREYGIVDIEEYPSGSTAKTWPVVKIPQDISSQDAVYLILISVAFYAVTDARTGLGDSLLNYGLGIVGNFVSQIATLAGALPVVGLEPSPKRRLIAEKMGITNVFDPLDDSTVKTIREITEDHDFDVVIDSTGVEEVICEALQNAADFGRVVICGGIRENVLLDLYYVQRKNISLIGSRMPFILQEGPKREFVDVKRVIKKIFAYIRAKRIKASSLTTHVITPEDAITLYSEIRQNRDTALGVVIDWIGKK